MSIQQSINSMLNTTAGALVGAKALSQKAKANQPQPSASAPNPYSVNALKGWKTRRARQVSLQESKDLQDSIKTQQVEFKGLLDRFNKPELVR